MQSLPTTFTVTALFFVLFSLFSAPMMAEVDEEPPSSTEATEAPLPLAPLPLEELRIFTQVFEHIRNAYVEEVDDETLLKNAIIGMLTQLDPHSTYLDESSFDDLQESTSGEFGGLGIEVGMENGFVEVISPIDDTPAQRAGIEAGDLIIKINNTPVKGMSLSDAVGMMRGKKGTGIDLTLIRDGLDQPLDITIVRDIIKVVSVKSRTLEPGFAYVRIAQFQIHTAEDLEKAIQKRQDEIEGDIEGGIKGLVLDLRNNPGGVLQGSVDVSDLFLSSGKIVYTEGRVANSDLEYEATEGDILNGAPMVILINDGSASASEIVAGALQDHKRAIILGTKSFGKGSVQTVIPLTEDRAIKMTTARYYTPNGRSIQAEGITPDIIVERALLEAIRNNNYSIKEANLAGHLESETENKSKAENNSDKKSDDKTSDGKSDASRALERLKKDNQLHDALNILKAIYLNQQSNIVTADNTDANNK